VWLPWAQLCRGRCDELILGFCSPQTSAQSLLVATINIQVKCPYCLGHSNACSQLCWCSGNEPNGQTGSTPSLNSFIHDYIFVWDCVFMDVYDCTCRRTGQFVCGSWGDRMVMYWFQLVMITNCRRVNSSWNIYHRLKEPFLATSYKINQSICLSIWLSIYLSSHPSICMSTDLCLPDCV